MIHNNNKQKKPFSWKQLLRDVGIIVSILGVLTSIFIAREANQGAKQSNKIAQQSLDNTEKRFVIERRPYLSLKPVKFTKNDRYILAKETKDGFEIEVQFEMYNSGQTPATNIRIPDKICVSGLDGLNKSEDFKIQCVNRLGTTALAPQEFFYIGTGIEYKMSNKQDVLDNLKRIENNQFSFLVNMVIFYSSNLDSSQEYKTLESVRFWSDDIDAIRSEMI